MSSNFMIGTDLIYDFLALDELLALDDPDPDWTFQPFSSAVLTASGKVQGQGFPIARWRWNALSQHNRQIFRSLVGSNLSGPIFIRTSTNDVDIYDANIFKTYEGIMAWTDQDEDLQGNAVLTFLLTFTHLVEVIP